MNAAFFFATLPAAKSGILAGIVLGIGRAIGETMAVIMIAGNQTEIPGSIFEGVRTLTANIVLEMGYAADLHREALIATAVVLFVFILLINLLLSLFREERSMKQINIRTFKDKWNSYRKNPLSLILFLLVTLAAAITILVLAFLIVYILIKGIPNLNLDLFAWEYNTENVSMMPAIINTLIMTVILLLIAAPLGIFAAIYLAEYARARQQIGRRDSSYR